MKIALLARNPNLYSHKRLIEAAEARGHQIDWLNTLRCTVHIASHKPEVYYDSEPCIGYDAVIPRIGASITNYGLAILRQFEMRGCWPLNESVAIGRSRDKLRSLQILAKHGLGLPLTAYANDPKKAEERRRFAKMLNEHTRSSGQSSDAAVRVDGCSPRPDLQAFQDVLARVSDSKSAGFSQTCSPVSLLLKTRSGTQTTSPGRARISSFGATVQAQSSLRNLVTSASTSGETPVTRVRLGTSPVSGESSKRIGSRALPHKTSARRVHFEQRSTAGRKMASFRPYF